MPGQKLAEKIGYEHPRRAISKIYDRNEDELQPFVTVVKLGTVKGERNTRLFDEQGCYIVAMLAKTPQAKAFRKGLAAFMQQLRADRSDRMQMRYQIAAMQEKYDDLKQKIAKAELLQTLSKSRWTMPMLERMDELHGILTWDEISRLFNYSRGHCQKMWKRYRATTGDFRDLTPKSLQQGDSHVALQ